MKSAIFLSASVPVRGRGVYFETANPFLIQCAVRELVIATIRKYTIVWGGHPAITPMIWAICEDLGISNPSSVELYQSRFFGGQFPDENNNFSRIIYTDVVENDRIKSLQKMRDSMLSRKDLVAAVFIGGMDGVEEEFALFRSFHSKSKVLPLRAPGGAARVLAEREGDFDAAGYQGVDFAGLFHSVL